MNYDWSSLKSRESEFIVTPVHISTVHLSETEEPPLWFGSLPEKILEFGIFRLVQIALPSLVLGLFTNLALKSLGSIFCAHSNSKVQKYF